MTARSSDGRRPPSDGRRPPAGALEAALRDERGAILLFMVLALVVVLGATGLAVDLGRGYVERVRISRAIDAGALSAARSLRQGQGAAAAAAIAVARSNGVVDGQGGVATSISFGTNAAGESTVDFTARREVPTIFMRYLGQPAMEVGASATAAVPPVDLALVLDQSGSLGSAGAWDDLQAAATTFVQQFDDLIDQVALISFQVRAHDWFPLGSFFTGPVSSQIAAMSSAGDTNTGEGLRLAGVELAGVSARPDAAKVIVFFTDGRPTAFRDMMGDAGDEEDRAIAVSTVTTGRVRGYFDDPDLIPMGGLASPDGCAGVSSCFGMNEAYVRDEARDRGLEEAEALRTQGFVIFTIGLGNPAASDPILQPDLDYLRRIANEGGVEDPAQPQGEMFFAPSAAELQAVFDRVAQALLVRLTS